MHALLKMGILDNSIVGVLSTITNKASEECLKFFEGCSMYSAKVFHYSPNFCVGRKVSNLSEFTIYTNINALHDNTTFCFKL